MNIDEALKIFRESVPDERITKYLIREDGIFFLRHMSLSERYTIERYAIVGGSPRIYVVRTDGTVGSADPQFMMNTKLGCVDVSKMKRLSISKQHP